MKDHQIKRESSDTFGRNVKADIELFNRIAAQNDNRGAEMLSAAIVAAALAITGAVIGAIASAILS